MDSEKLKFEHKKMEEHVEVADVLRRLQRFESAQTASRWFGEVLQQGWVTKLLPKLGTSHRDLFNHNCKTCQDITIQLNRQAGLELQQRDELQVFMVQFGGSLVRKLLGKANEKRVLFCLQFNRRHLGRHDLLRKTIWSLLAEISCFYTL